MSSEVIKRAPEALLAELPTVHIKPAGGWLSLGGRELWEYRELLIFLVWRDVKVRYKQKALGAAWAVIQPLFMMLVFSLFFGLWRMSSTGMSSGRSTSVSSSPSSVWTPRPRSSRLSFVSNRVRPT